MNIATTEQAKKAANQNSTIKHLLNKGWCKTGFYEYQDENDNPIYWRIRLDPPKNSEKSKWIRPFYFDGKEWVLKEPPFKKGKKPLYRLPAIKNSASDTIIYIAEGEKCADALAKLGITATTSGSVTSANDADWSYLAGRQIIIWRDNDDAGLRYAESVTVQLLKINCAVQYVDIEQLKLESKGDCVDWLMSNPTASKQDIENLPLITLFPEIIPLIKPGESLPYPVELLPKIVRDAVLEYQDYGQQPVSLIATSALSSMSLVCQGLADIARDSHLISPLSLYFISIADSGERKSAADNIFSKTLRQWETNKLDEMEFEIKKNKDELAVYTAKKNGLIGKIKNETIQNKSTYEPENKLKSLIEPKKIIIPKLFHEEATTEALSFNLASGWQSSSLWSDEAGIVVGGYSMNQDNILKGITLLNRLWDGKDYSVDRKTSENFKIRGRRLMCSLMMQPAVFEQFINRSGKISRGSGFLARCLIIKPQSTIGTRTYKEYPKNMPAITLFNNILLELLNIGLPLDEHGMLKPPVLTLSPEAKLLWTEFHDAAERELSPGGEYAGIKDFGSKIAENAARLAGIFHIFERKTGTTVDAETMQNAIGVIIWYLHEIKNVMGIHQLPQEYEDAHIIINWLSSAKIQIYSIAELLRYSPIRDKERRNAALKVLEEHYYIKKIDKQIIVNPELMEENNV